MKKKHINSIIKEISHYYKREAILLVELLREHGVQNVQIAKKLEVTKSAITLRFPKKGKK